VGTTYKTLVTSEWSIGQILLDAYVVDRVLGEGGMGKVYLLKSQTTGMQFAVKRAKGLSDADRRNFLAELQTWIDLPEHPNLVPCRFFRTVADEVLIFAEFVEGGSLKDWIDSGKLYEGGKEKALERILDTAIQFAWGLHCVHELGLVHQDVKPANVMMGTGAQVAVQGLKAMVSDYGLARARAASGERYEPDLGRSILVSSGGYTPAYCSPEQLSSQKLDRRTDVWSWGVSVMEMFQGEVTWRSGSVAAEALESFLEHNGEGESIPAMPSEVEAILWGCFCVNLEVRWKNLEIVVQKLRAVYQMSVGTEYSNVLGKIEHRTTPQVGAGERRTRHGTSWTDPREWLERALKEDGIDPFEAAEIVSHRASSRRGQLVADVAAFDEVSRIYERLITSGRKDLENVLGKLCHDAAAVHATADDTSGAVALYDRAIEIYERLVNIEDRSELANDLACFYVNKGIAVGHLGDKRAAMALYDRAIEIYERLVNIEGRRELADYLATNYRNKANMLLELGDNLAALVFYDRAIEIRERLVNVEGRSELANGLAALYGNKAVAVSDNGNKAMAVSDNFGAENYRAAMALYDRAIEIMERLVNVEERRELANNLAGLYMNKANAVSKDCAATLFGRGDYRAAVLLYDKAIEITEQLINVDGRWELASELAGLYMNKAAACAKLSDNHTAVTLEDRATEIMERLVNVEGRDDLADKLANLYRNKALSNKRSGDNRGALVLYDRSISLYERMVNVDGRSELGADLLRLYKNKSDVLTVSGYNQAAEALNDKCLAFLEQMVNVKGRNELASSLADLYSAKAFTLWDSGNDLAAEAIFDSSIELLERMVNVYGENDLAGDLDMRYVTRGSGLVRMGDVAGAVALYDRAINIFERLVNVDVENLTEHEFRLAYHNKVKANALSIIGDKHSALACFDRAINIYERLDLADDLLELYSDKAKVVQDLGEYLEALTLFDRAIEMCKRLVNVGGRSDQAHNLSDLYEKKSIVAKNLENADA